MERYSGIVQEGTKRAATLGFPTINIPLGNSDVSGIYAARVVMGEKEYPAAAFADPKRKILEAHLLDFSSRAKYREKVTITLHKKIRAAQHFQDDVALRAAIAADIAAVRKFFAA